MKFGPVSPQNAAGAILAHTVRAGDLTIRKGRTLSQEDSVALAAAGFEEVVVARLEEGDIHEDAAALAVAEAVAGHGVRVEKPFTGRANLFAEAAGIACIDKPVVDGLNGLDPAITLATVPAFSAVAAGQMVATAKIIPFAVSSTVLAGLLPQPAVSVAPYVLRKIGLVATMLPALKSSVMDKTRRLLEARLAPAGAALVGEERVPHEAASVAAALQVQLCAGAEAVIVFGASAVMDEADVIPSAIVAAGGIVERIGMPVDPGNLLVLGHVGTVPVLGAPGCARSARENGFDWVLSRILAGLRVSSADIAAMGVGGLLTDIPSRPHPRMARES